MEVRSPFERLKRGPAATVDGGYGRVPASTVDTTKTVPAAKVLSPKDAEALMWAEMLQAVRDVSTSATELTARIGRGGTLNGVLDVFLGELDVDGQLVRSYPVVVGSVVVVNHDDTAPMLVTSQPEHSSAPNPGRGVQRVDPGQRLPVPIGTRTLSIWGTPGAQVSVQVYTGLQPIGGGGL